MQLVEVLRDERIEADVANCRNNVSSRVRLVREPCLRADLRTTLVVAHRLSTVRALDRLLVLDKGRIIEEGNHETLIKLENGLYRRLFERQALELIKGLTDSEVTHKTTGAKANRTDDSTLLVGK